MSGDVTPYTALITSEHNQRPKFTAMVAAVVQGPADQIAVLDSIPGLLNVYTAVGQQLDFIGQWVGVSRDVILPQAGIFFSFDVAGLGFDQAVFGTPGGGGTTIVLDDATFRLLVLARIASNQWDGTIPGAYTVFDTLFEPFGYSLKIYDDASRDVFTFDVVGKGFDEGMWEGDDGGVMTMRLELDSAPAVTPPGPLLKALFKAGYLDIKPAGVAITAYLINGVII